MNIKKETININGKDLELKPLSPSEENKMGVDTVRNMYKTPGMQFKLSDGTILGRFGLGTNSPLFLDYHMDKTKNFSEFIDSLNTFLSNAKKKLTQSDINRLEMEYSKYTKQLLGSNDVISQRIVDSLM